MWIKNNSKREWKDYNCGDGVVITIKPESIFEVDDKAGIILLRNLGHERWLTETSAPREKNVEKKELPKADVKAAANKAVKDFDNVLDKLSKE